MRSVILSARVTLGLTLGLLPAAPALAGEIPLIGPAPDWVLPAPPIAPSPVRASFMPVLDEQVLIDGDTSTSYVDAQFSISSQDTLNKMGTVSISWQPAHGDVTVHNVEILRDGQKINLLDGGPGFTVLRREARMEQLTLDGTLTAIMPAQGLRIGDILRTAYSVSVRDPVLAGRAQTSLFLVPQPVSMKFGRARLVWPEAQAVTWKALMPGITATPRSIAGQRKELVISLPVAKLPDLPANIPARSRPMPLIEASSFASWQDVAARMAPLYVTDKAIAAGSDLAKVVDAIAAKNSDPVMRMAEALRAVQGDVRYQLIALGSGNYTPQQPADTWKMRYGDCKAKTLLLLAMLHRMGITAEPVLANGSLGDLVPDRLPAAQAFDHVFVRAEIAGESFWLDGTGLGARLADIRDVPRFGSVLPVRATGAELLKLPTRADARPAMAVKLDFDGSAGLLLPMPFTMKLRYTGASAEQLRTALAGGMDESLFDLAERNARNIADTVTITEPVASYDPADGAWTLVVAGLTYPNWDFEEGHWRHAIGPMIKIDFNPDRSKASWRALPALIPTPSTTQLSWSMKLPAGAATAMLEGAEPDKLALPALRFERNIRRSGAMLFNDELSAESGAEVASADIGAMRKAVNDVAEHKLRIIAPADYPMRWDEVARESKTPAMGRIRKVFDQRIIDKPEEAQRYADRGWFAVRIFDWAAAEADYAKATALDPTAERYLQLRRIQATRGDFVGGLKNAQAANELEPDNKEVINSLAFALADVGKYDEALDLIEADPDITKDDGEGLIASRADLLIQAGRVAEGVELLDNALLKKASSTGLLNARCWMKGLANIDLEGAEADCNKAIELAGQPAAIYDSRAMVHFRAGHFPQARADLDAALAIDPELAASRFMRGMVLTRLGDRKNAASDFNAARKLRPNIDAFFGKYGIKP